MQQTVVGVFDRYCAAHDAAQALASRGLSRDRIHIDAVGEDASTARSGHRATEMMAGVCSFFAEIFGPDDDSRRARAGSDAEAGRRGSAMVAVDVGDAAEFDTVIDTLESAGAFDIEEKVCCSGNAETPGNTIALPAGDSMDAHGRTSAHDLRGDCAHASTRSTPMRPVDNPS